MRTEPRFQPEHATRVAANDKDGRERLCRYILRPPLANDRLKILDDGSVRLGFKRPWSGEAVAKKILIAMRLFAEVPKLHPASPPPGQDGDSRGRRTTSTDRATKAEREAKPCPRRLKCVLVAILPLQRTMREAHGRR